MYISTYIVHKYYICMFTFKKQLTELKKLDQIHQKEELNAEINRKMKENEERENMLKKEKKAIVVKKHKELCAELTEKQTKIWNEKIENMYVIMCEIKQKWGNKTELEQLKLKKPDIIKLLSTCYPLDIYIKCVVSIKYNDSSKYGYQLYDCTNESILQFCDKDNFDPHENPQIIIYDWSKLQNDSHFIICNKNKDDFFLKAIMDSLLEYGSDGFTIYTYKLNNEIRTIYTLCGLFNIHISLIGANEFITYMISAVNKN